MDGGRPKVQVLGAGQTGFYPAIPNLVDVSLSPCSSVVRNCETVRTLATVDLQGPQPHLVVPRLEWVDFAVPHADNWKLTLSFMESKEVLPHQAIDNPRPEFLLTFRLRHRLRHLLCKYAD